MLRINLQRVCKIHGIEKPSIFLQSHGFTFTTANRALKGEYVNFGMFTMEKLCLIFHCTPNDLLEWVPPKSGEIPETEPLFTLRRLNKVASVSQLINGASLEQLEKMEEIIRKEMAT